MIEKIVKFLVTAIIVFLLIIIPLYFFLTGIIAQADRAKVQGVAAPSLSRKQGQTLLHHHGIKVSYTKNGYWYFHRDGKECRLIKK